MPQFEIPYSIARFMYPRDRANRFGTRGASDDLSLALHSRALLRCLSRVGRDVRAFPDKAYLLGGWQQSGCVPTAFCGATIGGARVAACCDWGAECAAAFSFLSVAARWVGVPAMLKNGQSWRM